MRQRPSNPDVWSKSSVLLATRLVSATNALQRRTFLSMTTLFPCPTSCGQGAFAMRLKLVMTEVSMPCFTRYIYIVPNFYGRRASEEQIRTYLRWTHTNQRSGWITMFSLVGGAESKSLTPGMGSMCLIYWSIEISNLIIHSNTQDQSYASIVCSFFRGRRC